MSRQPVVVGLICARGGSKGVPGKNVRPLAGKPLLAYAVEAGLQSPRVSRVIVSTDDEKIAEVAREFGAEVPFMRPAELATDTSPEWLSWRHAAEFLLSEHDDASVDAIVVMPATAPMRAVEDVEKCIDMLFDTDADMVITVTDPPSNPYFTMVKLDESGGVSRLMDTGDVVRRRQDAPAVFDITPVAYAFRLTTVLNKDSLFDGDVRAVYVPPERASDIDTELEFEFFDYVMRRKLGMDE